MGRVNHGLWSAHVPNKVEIHLWRSNHDALSAEVHLKRRAVPIAEGRVLETLHSPFGIVEDRWKF